MATSQDYWQNLQKYTSARIGLGRAGTSVPTKELLKFQLAHAKARDAVHSQVDFEALKRDLLKYNLPILELSSQVKDRSEYLQRPDKGRMLDEYSIDILKHVEQQDCDIILAIADGLSALAIEKNIISLLDELLPRLNQLSYRVGPLCLVKNGRVAIGDEIGELLKGKIIVVLIGERPGLSSPDSLGIYFTYQPRKGLTDERRNCISNIREGGLPYVFAAEKLVYLLTESFRRKISGVDLKDDLTLKLEE